MSAQLDFDLFANTSDQAATVDVKPFALELLGSNGSVIGRTFHLMGIAEDVIATAKRRYPFRVNEVDEIFGKACPPEGMTSTCDDVYRAHVTELCVRAGQGLPSAVTNAHAVIVLAEISLKAPLRREFANAYAIAFKAAFPNKKYFKVHDSELAQAIEALEETKRAIKSRLAPSYL